jgi:ribonuclease PH
MNPRPDARRPDALRDITFETGVQRHVAGSVLVKWGHTHVLCAATFEDRVPGHRLQSGGGWLTAEYAMLPGATQERQRRERPNVSGRTAEIQRLIGRSLRAVINLDQIGPRTLWIDCDVVQADGGTRCASITAAYVASVLAIRAAGLKLTPPPVAAVSVGIVKGQALLDLCYTEDSTADVDLNYVATPSGIVEVQGTAEGKPFPRPRLDALLDLGQAACTTLFELQTRALDAAAGR